MLSSTRRTCDLMAHGAAPLRPTGVFGQLGIFGQGRRPWATWALSPVSTLGRHTLPSLEAWGKSPEAKADAPRPWKYGQEGSQMEPAQPARQQTSPQQVTSCLPNGGAPERRRPQTKQPHTSCDRVPRHRNPASRVTHNWQRNGETHPQNADCPKHVISTNKTEPLNNKPHFQGGPHTTPAKRRLALVEREYL